MQAAEAKVKQEERTVPGEDPGIYACDYKKLAQIHSKVAQGRVALLQGDFAGAQVIYPRESKDSNCTDISVVGGMGVPSAHASSNNAQYFHCAARASGLKSPISIT